jgi:hypothetical protein
MEWRPRLCHHWNQKIHTTSNTCIIVRSNPAGFDSKGGALPFMRSAVEIHSKSKSIHDGSLLVFFLFRHKPLLMTWNIVGWVVWRSTVFFLKVELQRCACGQGISPGSTWKLGIRQMSKSRGRIRGYISPVLPSYTSSSFPSPQALMSWHKINLHHLNGVVLWEPCASKCPHARLYVVVRSMLVYLTEDA